MNPPLQVRPFARKRTHLDLYVPPPPDGGVAYWRINGHRAVVVVWTAEEWEGLVERPADAQQYPCGVWCALRLEEDPARPPA